MITGIGGHSDFCAGASRSAGGMSVIAVRSTAADGSPTIVERVDLVSTQRSDIDIVVTEHGIADLRNATEHERHHRLLDDLRALIQAPVGEDRVAADDVVDVVDRVVHEVAAERLDRELDAVAAVSAPAPLVGPDRVEARRQ